jgi:DnaJ-class molecular chaperone
MQKETVTDARPGKNVYRKGCLLGIGENMSKCKKCNGAGGMMWITSAGTDAQWEYCDECGGTGEAKDEKNKMR